MLGQLLMTIRKELTETSSPSKPSHQPSHSNSSYSHKGKKANTTSHTSILSPNWDAIRFYEELKPYNEFTPYSGHSVMMDGVKWPTLNHYFQAQKLTKQMYRNEVLEAATPKRATYLAKILYSQVRQMHLLGCNLIKFFSSKNRI